MTRPDATPAARLRAMIREPGIIMSMGAHDVFSAMIMDRARIGCLFAGGFGASASLLGLPDLNFISAAEMADHVRRITSRVRAPLVADGDTGHGDLHNVRRTVELFERAGAAGMILEDQVFPKRCGHFGDKRVIDAAEMELKIRAALQARSDPDFVLFARTDARAVHGIGEAVARVRRYCEAGADVAFVEAPQSVGELELVAREVPFPLFANMLTGGATPILPADALRELGYKFVVPPVESLMVCGRALELLCARFLERGRVDEAAGEMMTFAEVKRTLGLEEWLPGAASATTPPVGRPAAG